MTNNIISTEVPFIVISKRAFVLCSLYLRSSISKWCDAQEAFAEEEPWQELEAASRVDKETYEKMFSWFITQTLPSAPNNIKTHHLPGRDQEEYLVPSARCSFI